MTGRLLTIGPRASGSGIHGRHRLHRLGAIFAGLILVIGSLLTFPSAIPLLIIIWLVLYTALVLAGREMVFPLVLCVVILLIKNIDWPISVPVFMIVCSWVAIQQGLLKRFGERSMSRQPLARGKDTIATEQQRSSSERSGFRMWLRLAALWLAAGWVAGDWQRGSTTGTSRPMDSERPILCLGDSLTAAGYPELLARRINAPVINLGEDGITSSMAREVVESEQFIEARPQALVLAIGGHDYNQGQPRSVPQENIEAIIRWCLDRDCAVVLVEIPRGFITDPYGGIERRLARQYDLQVVPDSPIRQFVYYSPIMPPGMWMPPARHLSNDGLHPNTRGNQVFADYVRTALDQVFKDSSLPAN